METIDNKGVLRFAAKRIRAQVIAQHLGEAGLPLRCVCFTCGNAARALRNEGLYVVEVGSQGRVEPTEWVDPTHIAGMWPGMFDATSGHLPVWMMERIGAAFAVELGELPGKVVVPSGSGETLVCLALAYPDVRFVARYDMTEPPTMFNEDAALNGLVRRLAHKVEIIQG